jgi:hypothetical protein
VYTVDSPFTAREISALCHWAGSLDLERVKPDYKGGPRGSARA